VQDDVSGRPGAKARASAPHSWGTRKEGPPIYRIDLWPSTAGRWQGHTPAGSGFDLGVYRDVASARNTIAKDLTSLKQTYRVAKKANEEFYVGASPATWTVYRPTPILTNRVTFWFSDPAARSYIKWVYRIRDMPARTAEGLRPRTVHWEPPEQGEVFGRTKGGSQQIPLKWGLDMAADMPDAALRAVYVAAGHSEEDTHAPGWRANAEIVVGKWMRRLKSKEGHARRKEERAQRRLQRREERAQRPPLAIPVPAPEPSLHIPLRDQHRAMLSEIIQSKWPSHMINRPKLTKEALFLEKWPQNLPGNREKYFDYRRRGGWPMHEDWLKVIGIWNEEEGYKKRKQAILESRQDRFTQARELHYLNKNHSEIMATLRRYTKLAFDMGNRYATGKPQQD